jgi:hypothetical protein
MKTERDNDALLCLCCVSNLFVRNVTNSSKVFMFGIAMKIANQCVQKCKYKSHTSSMPKESLKADHIFTSKVTFLKGVPL